KVVALQREILALKGQDPPQLELRLKELQEQLAACNRKLFGDSSEKRRRSDEVTPLSAERPPQTGHGPRPQPKLPFRDVAPTLADDDKTCDLCGGVLDEWPGQFEESEEIDVIERQFVIKRHKRHKYRCRCTGCVKTAPGSLKLFEKARYSID